MGSPSRNVQYHPPRLSEDRLNLPQPHSPSLPTHCSGKSGMRPRGCTRRPGRRGCGAGSRNRSRCVPRRTSGPLQLFGEPLQLHQLAQTLLHAELQVLAQQGPVDVLLVDLDDRIDDGSGALRHDGSLHPRKSGSGRNYDGRREAPGMNRLSASRVSSSLRPSHFLPEIVHHVAGNQPRSGRFPATWWRIYWPALVCAGTLPCGLSAATPGPDGPRRVNQSVPSASRSSFGVCACSSGNGK